EGRDLDHVVRERGPMRVVDGLDCLIQAARGLEAAHAQGFVHGDIKPSNLMLDRAGTVRVLDLGLALIVDSGHPSSPAAGRRLTDSRMALRTIDYMAPERAGDPKETDQRADIYSLGCTLYYLLTGREPFVGETVLERLRAHRERAAPSLRAVLPSVPDALERTYRRMMAKRPEDRPESMTEVIALLESCQAAASAAAWTAGDSARTRSKPMDFDEGPAQPRPAVVSKPGRESSIIAHRDDELEGLPVGPELSLKDLMMDVRPEVPLVPPLPSPIQRAVKPQAPQPQRAGSPTADPLRRPSRPVVVSALAAAVLLAAVLVRVVLFPSKPEFPQLDPSQSAGTSEGTTAPHTDRKAMEKVPHIPKP